MTDPIRDFENDCAAAGVSPTAAIRAGGLNPSTWFRWKSQGSSPTLRSLVAAKNGLALVIAGRAGTLPSDAAPGALEKSGDVQ